ncbi:MAG: aconitase family protein [Planctomycetota bacterium]|jgi:3-isopropylmalate/(R)-2-methylmalate dehydratase large subunit
MTAVGTCRVAAVLATHVAGDTPDTKHATRDIAPVARDIEPGTRVSVRLDNVLLDGPTATKVLAAHATLGRRAPANATARFAFVAGVAQPLEERRALITFAREHDMALKLDPARAGLPAVVAADEGLVDFDHLVAGATPDVAGLGGLGCVALRCDPAELARCLCGDSVETVVPETRILRVNGRLDRWVGPTDLGVAVWETVGGAEGLAGAVLELRGPAIARMEVADRLSLCATLASAGITAICPPDASTLAWIAARRPGVCAPLPGSTAEDAPEEGREASESGDEGDVATLNARKVRMTAVELPWPGTRGDPTEGGGPRVEHVVLAGRVEDLRVAAEVLRDRQVRPGLLLEVRAASSRVLLHAIEEGLIADLLRAGACLLPAGPVPSAAEGERRVVSVPTGGGDVLVNPAVAAATAVAGGLTDPESMRRAQRRTSRRR